MAIEVLDEVRDDESLTVSVEEAYFAEPADAWDRHLFDSRREIRLRLRPEVAVPRNLFLFHLPPCS